MHPIVEFLKEIDRNPGQTPQLLLDTILRECRNFSAAEAGTIFLVRIRDGERVLEPMSLQNDAMEVEPNELIVPVDTSSLSGYVAVTGESLTVDDAYDIPDNQPYTINNAFDFLTGYETRSVASIALRRHDGDVGAVVQLINRRSDSGEIISFEREQIEFIAAAGVVMTGVIDRAEMMERLAESNRELKERSDRIEALQLETEAALREAEKSSKAKSEFLNCIGHELKTPLNAIIGFSELLENEGFGPLGHPSYGEFAAEVTTGGRKLLNIVDDILGIVQAESKTAECADNGSAAYGCIVDTCRAWFDEAAEKNIIFAVEISDAPAECAIDTTHLQTTLDRLIDNALKFTHAGGEITVDAGPWQSGGLYVTVTDTGVGMSSEEIDRALTPFGQADSSLARGHEGAGLGLTLASALTRSMQGTFSVESEPGKGTHITMVFPADRKPSTATTAMITEPATAMWVSG